MPSTSKKRTPGATPLHYRLTNDEWLRAVRELKPRERDILYYLRTLDPFGDCELDIKTRDIAEALSCSAGTVSDALKSLNCKGWIDMTITSTKVRLRSGSSLVGDRHTSSDQSEMRSPHQSAFAEGIAKPIAPAINLPNSDRSTDQAIAPPISDRPTDQAEIAVQIAIQEFSTEDDFLPKQTNQICFKNTGTSYVENRSLTTGNMDSKADLIPVISQGCTYLENVAGVSINPPLKAVIEQIAASNPERFLGRIEASVCAYLEQRPKVRSAQAFISAALQRGFTSNDWKVTQKPKASKLPKLTEKENIPRAAATPVNLSGLLIEIQTHCQRLGINVAQALERFGRTGKNLSMLSDIDLATLRSEMVGW